MPKTATPEDWQVLDERVAMAKTAVAAQKTFGANLLREIVNERPRQNVFISPLSVFLALAMTEAGSAGTTRTAMRKALALPSAQNRDSSQNRDRKGADAEAAALNESAEALQRVLRMPGGAELTIANALWTDAQIKLAPDFVKLCETAFFARASSLAFADPKAADEINNWVKANTNGKIGEIVTPAVVRAAAVILTNAVYFAGKWQSPFPKSDTSDEAFHKTGASTKTVPMMHHANLKNSYRRGKNFDGALLSYQGSSMYLYALLPDAGKTPSDVLASLDLEHLGDSPTEFDLDLKLPRFSLDFSADLGGFLKKMGMGIAFRYPEADFLPMGSRDFFISAVIHKTRLEVDEEGTVAAAATAVMMGAGSAAPRPREKKTLIFNRPFVVLICEQRTGSTLFAGVIEDP